jgi:hypothetical protein
VDNQLKFTPQPLFSFLRVQRDTTHHSFLSGDNADRSKWLFCKRINTLGNWLSENILRYEMHQGFHLAFQSGGLTNVLPENLNRVDRMRSGANPGLFPFNINAVSGQISSHLSLADTTSDLVGLSSASRSTGGGPSRNGGSNQSQKQKERLTEDKPVIQPNQIYLAFRSYRHAPLGFQIFLGALFASLVWLCGASGLWLLLLSYGWKRWAGLGLLLSGSGLWLGVGALALNSTIYP